MKKTDHIDDLNSLLEKNYDAIAGYTKAKEKTDVGHLLHFFNEQIILRYNFAKQLISVIEKMGGTPIEEGSTKAKLHRSWIDLKTIFSSDNEESIIKECIRGEEAIIEEYNDFIKQMSSDEYGLTKIIESHLGSILSAITALKVKNEIFD